VCVCTFRMSQPLFIGGVLAYFNTNETEKADLGYAYMCAFGLVFSMFTSMVLQNVTLIEILHCGMKMRIACCSMIFRKVCTYYTSFTTNTFVSFPQYPSVYLSIF